MASRWMASRWKGLRFMPSRWTPSRVARAVSASRPVLGSATRNRIQSLAAAAAICGGAVLLLPEPERRAPWLYGAVLTLGYGHLLGGALLGRRPLAAALRRGAALAPGSALPPRVRKSISLALALGLGLGGLAILYAAYASALGHWPLLSGLLLAIATWHTVENDLAMPESYRHGLHMPPVSLDADTQVAAGGITTLVLSVATAALAGDLAGAPERAGADAFAGIVPGMRVDEGLLGLRSLAALAGGFLMRRPGHGAREGLGLGLIVASAVDPAWICARTNIAFVDVFALSTLYHLANWWVFSLEKCRKPSTGAGFRLELIAVHALPVCFLGATFLGATWIGSHPTGAETGAALRSAFLSPAPYLFWSLGHVIQTAAGRRSSSAAQVGSAFS